MTATASAMSADSPRNILARLIDNHYPRAPCAPFASLLEYASLRSSSMSKLVNHSTEKPTLLELVLRWHGEFRKCLEPIRVTPLQAGVILYLQRHMDANMTDTADALSVRLPTLSEVVKNLVQKRWVIKRRSVTDTRVVHVRLSRRGETLAQRIEEQVRQVSIEVTANKDLTAAGLKRLPRVLAQLKEASS